MPSVVATPDGPTLTVQSGPRNARTDPESGLRFYTWLGRELPSVTTIRRMAGIPFGLHTWGIGQVADYVLANAASIFQRLEAAALPDATPGLAATRILIKRELRQAADVERDRAAKLGTAVHDAAAAGKQPEDVAPELQPRLRQFLDWVRHSRAEIIGSEFQVFNLAVGYAGSIDALIRLQDGSVWLVDYKTGKGIYPDHALQVMAYLMADFVGADDIVNEELTELLRSVGGIAVLHLADAGWDFYQVRADAETWDAFRGLLTFAVWSTVHGDVASFTLAKRSGAAPQGTQPRTVRS